MSRKTIGVLYMLGVSFELLGAVEILSILDYRDDFRLISGILLAVAAAIMGTIAWIGMLLNLARAQAWTMFVLAFFFSGIILLIYLFSNAQTFAPKPSFQPQYGMQPQWLAQPGNAPYLPAQYPGSYPPVRGLASTPKDVIFKYGVIAGGLLQVITLVWTALCNLVPSLEYQDWLAYYAIYLGGPVLLSLPVFFWVSRAAARRSGQDKAGLGVALRACGWLMITCGLLFLSDIETNVQFGQSGFYSIPLPDIIQALLFFGVAYGLGLLAGRSGARRGIAAQTASVSR